MRYFFFIIISLLPLISVAQLSAPGMNAVRYTSYPSDLLIKDPIFIFCNSAGTEKGNLVAIRPGGSGVYGYSWFAWNDITKDFNTFIKTDTGVTSSSIIDLMEGGYKVKIDSAGLYDTSLVGWIFLDKPFAQAKLQNFTCDYVALSGKAEIDTFYYKDPADGAAIKLRNALAFLWSSDPSSAIPYPNLEINPVTFSPPLEDVIYKLQVTDSFLCVSESSFPYTSIHVKADFTVDPDKGEAPLDVTFTDKSIRGTKMYVWEFGEKTPKGEKVQWKINKDSIWIFSTPFTHKYYIPGEYSVKLTIESEQGCQDSLRFDKIVVEPSELKIPNVFTPNGDGINDFFIVESKSMRDINVEIYSRSGLMVYSFEGEGERLRDWPGWDGNIYRSSIKASAGVYFYIIRARGWDDKIYDSQEYRGFFYLYR